MINPPEVWQLAPWKKWWLENHFPFGMVHVQGRTASNFQGIMPFYFLEKTDVTSDQFFSIIPKNLN